MENLGMKERIKLDSDFWNGRRVLLTGHNGFKGTWLGLLLQRLGSVVCGISLPPNHEINMYTKLAPWPKLTSIESDIRNFSTLQSLVKEFQPQIVIHMAAQAIVFDAYIDPIGTIETNTMGTVYLLESLRNIESVEGILIITSDKVYENSEEGVDFTELSRLGGHEAYSASKAAAEILTSAYQRTYYSKSKTPVLTARAGNVIGGGDWSNNRLIPDLWRSYVSQKPVVMRNPNSVRPWQHVLDPIYGYLLYIQYAVLNINIREVPHTLNFGPPRVPTKSVLELSKQFSFTLSAKNLWTLGLPSNEFKESGFLSIDSSLALKTLGWKTTLSIDKTVSLTCDWYKAYNLKQDMRLFTESQVDLYAYLVSDLALSDNKHTESK